MLNKSFLMGKISTTLLIKDITEERKILKFTIAIKQEKPSKSGERKTDFIDCISWDKTAEFIAKNFEKGDNIIIEGKIETAITKDSKGNCRKLTSVVVESVNFWGPKNLKELMAKATEKSQA